MILLMHLIFKLRKDRVLNSKRRELKKAKTISCALNKEAPTLLKLILATNLRMRSTHLTPAHLKRKYYPLNQANTKLVERLY